MGCRPVLIKNAKIISSAKRVIADGYVYLKNGFVFDVGSSKKVPRVSEATIIDAGGRVVLPGFINPHMHLYSQFAKGMAVPRMSSFGEILEKLWWKLDKALNEEDVYFSALLGLIEAIKSGVTTVFDHHASYGFIKGSLNTVSQAFLKTGVRGCLCFEVSDRHGNNARDDAIRENAEFLESCMKNERAKTISSLCKGGLGRALCGMVGLHASMTLSDHTLAEARREMDNYSVGAHIHVAEGPEDVADAKRKYKEIVVKRLYNEGILRENTIAAHCVHVDKNDLDILKRSGTFVIHNPLSNLNNAVGVAPFLEMHKKKIQVGIGTDGMSAGIFGDVKLASVLHKLGGGVRHSLSDTLPLLQAGFAETKRSTMEINPQIASGIFGVKIGVLEKGAVADLVISDYIPQTPLTNENIWGHILFGVMNLPVRTTICAGRVLMKDFEIKMVDEEKIVVEAKKCAKKLWNRI